MLADEENTEVREYEYRRLDYTIRKWGVRKWENIPQQDHFSAGNGNWYSV